MCIRDSDNTCTNSSSVTINAAPTPPAAPALTTTQPTCAVPTGAITLTAIAGLEYQLDAGTFGAYPVGGWSGLGQGPHTITVRSTTDNTCTNSSSVTINAAPTPPAAPALTTTQPTCAVPTGAITLTAIAGLEYQLDAGTFGAYPVGGWSGLGQGPHTITVRSTTDNTFTHSSSFTITTAPATSAAPS